MTPYDASSAVARATAGSGGGFLLDADDPPRRDKLGREVRVATLCDELARRPTTKRPL